MPKRWIVGLLVLFLVLVYHPVTRPVVLFLLPLGASIDDLVVVVLGVLFIVGWTYFGDRLKNA